MIIKPGNKMRYNFFYTREVINSFEYQFNGFYFIHKYNPHISNRLLQILDTSNLR